MKIFDFFKKKKSIEKYIDEIELDIYPSKINFRLLYKNKPTLNSKEILEELKKKYNDVTILMDNDDLISYIFEEIKIELADGVIPAQCIITKIEDQSIPENAFQQNWHWENANESVIGCNYQLLLTDFMTIPLDYNIRTQLIVFVLVTITKLTNPDVIYSENGQKLISSTDLIRSYDEDQILFGLINVRLFNISNASNSNLLMDTVGLNSIGLPDLQIVFSSFDENLVASFLWAYSNYVYENGDIIKHGNTIDGIEENSTWKVERTISSIDKQNVVLNVIID